MNKEHSHFNMKGFSLVEIILSVALFGLFVTALSGIYLSGEENSVLIGNRNRAVFLAHQGLEAVRSIRDEDFSNLSIGTYGIGISGGVWNFNGSSDTTDMYTRDITISDYDTNVKEIQSRVNWQQNAQRTGEVIVRTLLSFWQEVIITGGDWLLPLFTSFVDFGGNTNATFVVIDENYAYVVMQTNANVDDFYVVDITDTLNPIITDTLNLSGQLRGIDISGDYAFISSTDNSEEVYAVDVSNRSNINLVDSLNLPGNQNMRNIQVNGNYLYATRDSSSSEFSIIDISNPTNMSLTGSTNLSSRYRSVYIDGSFAYLAGDVNNAELSVINITVPSLPVEVATLNLSGNTNATDIDGFGDRVFIAQGSDLEVVDISNPLLPTSFAVFNAGGFINAVEAVAALDYVFLATNDNSADVTIVDVSTPGSPVLLSVYDALSNLNDVVYHGTGDFIVAVGDNNTRELTVISPS